MFLDGEFSSDLAIKTRVNSIALKNLSVRTVNLGFQVSAANKMVGVEGRVGLLHRLGDCLESFPQFFGQEVILLFSAPSVQEPISVFLRLMSIFFCGSAKNSEEITTFHSVFGVGKNVIKDKILQRKISHTRFTTEAGELALSSWKTHPSAECWM